MVEVAEVELQCVLAGRQIQYDLGLASAEVPMLIVVRNRVFQLFRAQLCVDEQVMVAGQFLSVRAGATPRPETPNKTRNGELTTSPSATLTK